MALQHRWLLKPVYAIWPYNTDGYLSLYILFPVSWQLGDTSPYADVTPFNGTAPVPPDISYFLTTFPFISGSLASHVCFSWHTNTHMPKAVTYREPIINLQ